MIVNKVYEMKMRNPNNPERNMETSETAERDPKIAATMMDRSKKIVFSSSAATATAK